MNAESFISILVILLVAVCTFITRFLPFAIFGGGKEVPAVIKRLGEQLPPAIIPILVVYCLKGVNPMVYPHGLPELIAVAVVALLHSWRRNNLISIGGGTLIYMVLVQAVFV